MKISLICATIGRVDLLSQFLESLVQQTYHDFEVIIVDQSGSDLIQTKICCYSDKLNIMYLTSQKGLSRARNWGIRNATGLILGFPDDDCTYYPETLECVVRFFETGDDHIVLGRIYDKLLQKNIMRNWPSRQCYLDVFSSYRFGSSICIFSIEKGILMDEMLGAGAKYGCSEDVDFCLSHLKRGLAIAYDPRINVWHPDLNTDTMDLEKIRKYSFGVGALYAKHSLLLIMFMSVINQLVKAFNPRYPSKVSKVVVAYNAIRFRIAGFVSYRQEVR